MIEVQKLVARHHRSSVWIGTAYVEDRSTVIFLRTGAATRSDPASSLILRKFDTFVFSIITGIIDRIVTLVLLPLCNGGNPINRAVLKQG
jgi:hypothetical protein